MSKLMLNFLALMLVSALFGVSLRDGLWLAAIVAALAISVAALAIARSIKAAEAEACLRRELEAAVGRPLSEHEWRHARRYAARRLAETEV